MSLGHLSGLPQWDAVLRVHNPTRGKSMTQINDIKSPKPGTKLASLVKALNGKGATLKALSKSLAWQLHTVRAALTRLRQRGYKIERVPCSKGQPTFYRIGPAA